MFLTFGNAGLEGIYRDQYGAWAGQIRDQHHHIEQWIAMQWRCLVADTGAFQHRPGLLRKAVGMTSLYTVSTESCKS